MSYTEPQRSVTIHGGLPAFGGTSTPEAPPPLAGQARPAFQAGLTRTSPPPPPAGRCAPIHGGLPASRVPRDKLGGTSTPEAPLTRTSPPPPPAGHCAPVKKLAPPSELEQTLAFEVEFGATADTVRESFLEELRAWCKRAASGFRYAAGSTEPFTLVMRAARIKARGKSPGVIFAKAALVVRTAPTGQLAVYERWRRRANPASRVLRDMHGGTRDP